MVYFYIDIMRASILFFLAGGTIHALPLLSSGKGLMVSMLVVQLAGGCYFLISALGFITASAG